MDYIDVKCCLVMRVKACIHAKLGRDLVDVFQKSLEPEMKEFAAQRYDSKCTIDKDILNIEFHLGDITALRIALNSYFRYLTTCYNTIQILRDKEEKPR
jgi:tRNA threonylcarbamoyladenosine modification (KEOPS) complex  Pcc1 subunit